MWARKSPENSSLRQHTMRRKCLFGRIRPPKTVSNIFPQWNGCVLTSYVNHLSPLQDYFYRPETKFAKVMFLHVSVILSTVGGVRGKGGVARGHAWQGGCVPRAPPGRYYGYGIRSMSGRYASYWNAFLFVKDS